MKIKDSIDRQLARVGIAKSIQDADSMIGAAKKDQNNNPEGAIERINKALVLLRQTYTTAKDVDETLADQVKEKVKEGMALQKAIENALMGLPKMTHATKLETTKDVIDELDKQFADWNTKEKSKRDKI